MNGVMYDLIEINQSIASEPKVHVTKIIVQVLLSYQIKYQSIEIVDK
jgi:hypothetical protein